MESLNEIAGLLCRCFVPAGNTQELKNPAEWTPEKLFKIPYSRKQCKTMEQARELSIRLAKSHGIKTAGWIDGVLREDVAMIDFDDKAAFEAALSLVKNETLKCIAVRSRRGGHIYFKSTDEFKKLSYTQFYNALTLETDCKVGSNRNQIITALCLPDGQLRTVEHCCKELAPCPWYFVPRWKEDDFKANDFPQFLDLHEGARNDSFFRYAIPIKKLGKSYADFKDLVGLLNSYIVADPLNDEELDICTRPEAWEGVEDASVEDFDVEADFKGKFKHYIFGENFIAKYHGKNHGGKLYIYQDGIYNADVNIIRRAMRRERKSLTDNQIREALSYMKDAAPIIESKAEGIPFQNGLYTQGKLIQYSPDIFTTGRLACDFNPSAKCQAVDDFLSSATAGDEEKRKQLIECGAAALVGSPRLKKAVLLYGVANSGKSTFIDMLAAGIGADNISAVALQDLNQRFKLAELTDKRLNISEDTSNAYMNDMSVFKKVVSGDWLTAERKGEQNYKFRPSCLMLCAANELPRLNDKSEAALERFQIIPMNACFRKLDPTIRPRLRQKDAAEYFIKLAVFALPRLLEHGFTQSDESKEAREEYKRMNNPIYGFLQECEDKGRPIDGKDSFGHRVSTSDVYNRYKNFCDENGYKPESKNTFCRSVRALTGMEVKAFREGERVFKAFCYDLF